MRWTPKQEQIIGLRNRNLLVAAASRKRKDSGFGGADHGHDHRSGKACRY